MRMLIAWVAVATAAALGSANVAAGDHGIYGGVSTLGIGVGYKYSVNPSLGLRIGYNTLDYNHDTEDSGVHYDGKLKISALELLADYHPWAGSFAITAGIVYNKSKLTAHGQPLNATSITINDVTYTGSNVSADYENKLDSDKYSPYIGITWMSNPVNSPGLSFNARLGVMFQNPKGVLTTSGINDPTGTLETDRAAAEHRINDDADSLKSYPVLGVGLSYVF